MQRNRILCLLLAGLCLLGGCGFQRVDELYCLPKRSESYLDLQSVIDGSMEGLSYCAPISGQNRQTVQAADLDGNGQTEYLLFAKGTDEAPLKVLIFGLEDGRYQLCQTISGQGAAFDLVEYAQVDGIGGQELILGRQLSDQVLRSVTVYSMTDGAMTQLVTTQYTKILTCDLNRDQVRELMVLRPGENQDRGIAELYSIKNGALERSKEAPLSGTCEQLKRIITGELHGGQPGVFVASSVEPDGMITDIFTLVDGCFTNVSISANLGTSAQTLRSYYLYADDIDADGVVELPALIPMKPVTDAQPGPQQHLIRWYAVGADGRQKDKYYSFHNFAGGWYLKLNAAWASQISVVQEQDDYQFYLWKEHEAVKVFTIYALSGQDREAQAIAENRFPLLKTEAMVYAARMEVASGDLEITQADLVKSFHLIRQDWNTGEM